MKERFHRWKESDAMASSYARRAALRVKADESTSAPKQGKVT